ncbi:MAG: hypothetical protein A2046_04430 [Bacteroidetes bacterium GWA2_30_7]|nr:MAG: hypothetical protein A2046_04430 [Bacteroidetes bacterium GWA2_30_7]
MENTVNKVELQGFVGISPEHINFKDGNSILKFSLATNESYKDKKGEWQKQTTWHKIFMMNGNAEKASKQICRGNRVNIIGKLVNKSYVNKEGKKVYTTEIFAMNFSLVEKKPE